MSTIDTEVLCARANRDRTLPSFEKALQACVEDPIDGQPQILHLTLAPGVGGGHVEFFLNPIAYEGDVKKCLVIEIWRGISCFLRTNHGVMTNLAAWSLVTSSTTSAAQLTQLPEGGTG